jgi:hypothetical protein
MRVYLPARDCVGGDNAFHVIASPVTDWAEGGEADEQ